MHLLTILAFAFLFWRAEQPGRWVIVGENDVLWTALCVLTQPLLLALAAWFTANRAQRILARHADDPQIAQQYHHRASLLLRVVVLLGFGATVFLTHWPDWFRFGRITPALQVFGDLLVLTPFVTGMLTLWVTAYPLERALRPPGTSLEAGGSAENSQGWRFSSYMDFHLRHYLLVVAAPMIPILFAANMIRGYEVALKRWTGLFWAPDLLLGASAVCVFVAAPLILRRVWRTTTLEMGPVRERLEAQCNRIGMRFRDILVWHSDGIMINAAVMGLFSPVRFVLLSDALLATMSPRQIEAVFGHEVGHVRHRHIQHFLLFAFAGWLMVAGIMELLARVAIDPATSSGISTFAIEGVGVAATLLLWGVGFGWLSRRFERQADLFGALCATPPAGECSLPCSVHPDGHTTIQRKGRVCATGAAVFASALDRVAVLNGIPHEERSWRHSSIGSRIRALTALAGDPCRAIRFDRVLRRTQVLLVMAAISGSAAAAYYWMVVPEPAILQLQLGEPH